MQIYKQTKKSFEVVLTTRFFYCLFVKFLSCGGDDGGKEMR